MPTTSAEPDASTIAYRSFALAGIVARAQAENGLKLNTEHRERWEKYIDLTKHWFEKSRIEAHLTDTERMVMDKPTGHWNPGEVLEFSWRVESLVVLLWAINDLPRLPGYAAPSDVQQVMRRVPLHASTRNFRTQAQRRESEEIDAEHRIAQFWSWRTRVDIQRRIQQLPPDDPAAASLRAEVTRRVEDAMREGLIHGVIGGDVAVGRRPYETLDFDQRNDLMSVAYERHYALSWLRGDIAEAKPSDSANTPGRAGDAPAPEQAITWDHVRMELS